MRVRGRLALTSKHNMKGVMAGARRERRHRVDVYRTIDMILNPCLVVAISTSSSPDALPIDHHGEGRAQAHARLRFPGHLASMSANLTPLGTTGLDQARIASPPAAQEPPTGS
jgi:hypothetical protein